MSLALALLAACSSPPPAAGLADAGPVDSGPQDPCAASDLDGDGYGTHPLCPLIDCDDDNFGVHPRAVEACNGLDEDCDDEIDEELGESFCGAGACRALVPNCVDGRPSACEPTGDGSPEVCNGLDDDCDGETDEDLVGAECGVGACRSNAACVAGAWGACVPGPSSPEVCNGLDDDCDGETDEGFGVVVEAGSYLALAGHHPECDGATQRMGTACNAAIHRRCASAGCGGSGFGPLENSGDVAVLACVKAQTHEVPFAQLAGQHPGCDGAAQVMGPDCNAAINRWCAANGFVTGYGPVELGGAAARVACLRQDVAAVIQTSYTALSGQHGGCTTASRWGPDCNAAINRFCASQGYRTGFGPLENSGDVAVVACVRP